MVSYYVLVNGQPGETIYPSRGLRQGDHLSPYLFLLCVEGLSTLIDQAASSRVIREVPLVRGGTRLNHLLFADDCIFFGRANLEKW